MFLIVIDLFVPCERLFIGRGVLRVGDVEVVVADGHLVPRSQNPFLMTREGKCRGHDGCKEQ